jgi:hypothetical protein
MNFEFSTIAVSRASAARQNYPDGGGDKARHCLRVAEMPRFLSISSTTRASRQYALQYRLNHLYSMPAASNS